MKKVVLVIPILTLVIWILLKECKSKTYETALNMPVLISDSILTKKLQKQLSTTIDSFNSMKPVVKKAIEKMKLQDSLIGCYKKKLADTTFNIFELQRTKLDLYEARLEIKRLGSLKFYKIKF